MKKLQEIGYEFGPKGVRLFLLKLVICLAGKAIISSVRFVAILVLFNNGSSPARIKN